MLRKFSFTTFLALILLSHPLAFADDLTADFYPLDGIESASGSVIPRFQEVVPGVFRGGRPGQNGVDELSRSRIKTIINLDDDAGNATQEASYARSLGITTISLPMSPWSRPSDDQVNQALRALQTPALYPIFLHCKHGEDRTGMVIGLYRVLIQKWPAEQAYREMRAMGFHPILRGLDNYFRDRTGYKGH